METVCVPKRLQSLITVFSQKNRDSAFEYQSDQLSAVTDHKEHGKAINMVKQFLFYACLLMVFKGLSSEPTQPRIGKCRSLVLSNLLDLTFVLFPGSYGTKTHGLDGMFEDFGLDVVKGVKTRSECSSQCEVNEYCHAFTFVDKKVH